MDETERDRVINFWNWFIWERFMLKKITIELIPHHEQRYNTVGDWFLDEADPTHLVIRGSILNSKNPLLNWAVPLHEQFEALACFHRGISQETVDKFDKQWELDHPDSDEEPGDDPTCPYHKQHMLASEVEKEFIVEALGFDWFEYLDLLDELYLARRKAEAKARKKDKK